MSYPRRRACGAVLTVLVCLGSHHARAGVGKKGGGAHHAAASHANHATHHANMSTASNVAHQNATHANSNVQPSAAALGTTNPALNPFQNHSYGNNRSYNSGYHASGRRYSRNNGHANVNTGAVVSNLHSALTTLARSDHDYQGHRVKAMHAIGSAIHSLQGRSSTGNGNLTGNAGGLGNQGLGAGQNRQPQATSDNHIRQALQSLNTAHSRLTSQGNTGSHASARNSVQRAANELRLALQTN